MHPLTVGHPNRSFKLKVRQGGAETVKAFTLPVVCSLWTSDAKTGFGVAVLCYASYYEGGRKNQFKCLIPTEDIFRWVTHHALRNFRAFGGDDLPAYVEDWMKEWETSSAPRYGRGIAKQEVDVDADSSDSDATPLAQRKRGQPSDFKGKGPKKQLALCPPFPSHGTTWYSDSEDKIIETNMLTKGDYSKLSCVVYVHWRHFSPCRWQGFCSGHPTFEFVYHSLALLLLKGCFGGQGGPTPDTWVVHTR